MSKRGYIVRDYFKCWIDNDISVLLNNFHEDTEYIESWGSAYKGIDQLEKWFISWHEKGKVIKWDIKDIIEFDEKVICEWYFKFKYKDKEDEFNGVSIVYFDNENKITMIKEFMSVLPIRYPLD